MGSCADSSLLSLSVSGFQMVFPFISLHPRAHHTNSTHDMKHGHGPPRDMTCTPAMKASATSEGGDSRKHIQTRSIMFTSTIGIRGYVRRDTEPCFVCVHGVSCCAMICFGDGGYVDGHSICLMSVTLCLFALIGGLWEWSLGMTCLLGLGNTRHIHTKHGTKEGKNNQEKDNHHQTQATDQQMP